MEELVEVTVLIEGLMPYGGYTPVMAAVWETHAAGSIGRIGSPAPSNWRIGDVSNVVDVRISVGGKNRLKLTPGKSKAAPRVWIPALSHGQCNWPGMKDRNMEGFLERKVERKLYFCLTCSSPWLVHDISEYSHSIVIAHVLKVNVVHLRKKYI